MKTATDKNVEALTQIFGSPELAARVQIARIKIVTTQQSDTASGRLLAEALGEVLGRLWVNFEVSGPLAEIISNTLQAAAKSGAKPIDLGSFSGADADATVILGQTASGATSTDIFIGANGWFISAGNAVTFGDSRIPIGPAFAAGIAGAEVFKIIFEDALATRTVERISTFAIDLWPNGQGEAPDEISPVELGDLHVFGLGAVTHGLIWSLERWPAPVAAHARLIDHDSLEESNGQRYAGLREPDLGQKKADVIAARLMRAHGGIVATPYQTNLDDYFDQYEPAPCVRLAVVGLDSSEARRHVALKLPKRAINMWTEAMHLGSSRFGGWDGWPCLFCAYPETVEGNRDRVGALFQQLQMLRPHEHFRIEPKRLRDLLDNLDVLSLADAEALGPRMNLAASAIVGKPLSTVLQRLCATGHVPIAKGREVDVPLAFSSMLAGTVGFINLLAESRMGQQSVPSEWQYQLLGVPSAYLHTAAVKRSDCFVCSHDSV